MSAPNNPSLASNATVTERTNRQSNYAERACAIADSICATAGSANAALVMALSMTDSDWTLAACGATPNMRTRAEVVNALYQRAKAATHA